MLNLVRSNIRHTTFYFLKYRHLKQQIFLSVTRGLHIYHGLCCRCGFQALSC